MNPVVIITLLVIAFVVIAIISDYIRAKREAEEATVHTIAIITGMPIPAVSAQPNARPPAPLPAYYTPRDNSQALSSIPPKLPTSSAPSSPELSQSSYFEGVSAKEGGKKMRNIRNRY